MEEIPSKYNHGLLNRNEYQEHMCICLPFSIKINIYLGVCRTISEGVFDDIYIKKLEATLSSLLRDGD